MVALQLHSGGGSASVDIDATDDDELAGAVGGSIVDAADEVAGRLCCGGVFGIGPDD